MSVECWAKILTIMNGKTLFKLCQRFLCVILCVNHLLCKILAQTRYNLTNYQELSGLWTINIIEPLQGVEGNGDLKVIYELILVFNMFYLS